MDIDNKIMINREYFLNKWLFNGNYFINTKSHENVLQWERRG